MSHLSDESRRIAEDLDDIAERVLGLRRRLLAHPRDQRRIEPEREQVEAGCLVETADACERLGITSDHARKLARRGCGEKRGGRWLVDLDKAREALTR